MPATPASDAIASIRGQLAGLSKSGSPMEWASLQLQLGNALMAVKDGGPPQHAHEAGLSYDVLMAVKDGNPLQRAHEAGLAYHAALEVCSPEQDIDIWAQATAGLASAWLRMGLAQNGPGAALGRATLALRSAVDRYPRTHNPLTWAILQSRLAQVLIERARGWRGLESGRVARTHLAQALAALYSAGEVCNETMHSDQWQRLRKMIESAQAELNATEAEIERLAGKQP